MSENDLFFIKIEWRVSLPRFQDEVQAQGRGREAEAEIKVKTNDQIKLPFTLFNSTFKLKAVLQSLNVICE